MKTVYLLQDNQFFLSTALPLAIAEYARAHGGWLLRSLPLSAANARYLREHPVDGVIAEPRSVREWQLLRRMKIPTVALTTGLPRSIWPEWSVGLDEPAIGAAAAVHLVERGFKHFLFLGTPNAWSVARAEGFCEQLKSAGFTSQFAGNREPSSWPDWTRLDTPSYLDRLVDSITPRSGVMACNDTAAQLFIEACVRRGRSVPEDIAVVGVDNNVLTCEFGQIASSSVDPNFNELGARAAAMLYDILEGKPRPPDPVAVRPKGVVVRRSSDSYATADADVLGALDMARISPQVTVEQLAAAVAMSRATLERRFRAELGRSPAEEIRRRRLETARNLLVQTRRPLTDIAIACGFEYLSTFSKVFRREHGVSPSDFRRRAGNVADK